VNEDLEIGKLQTARMDLSMKIMLRSYRSMRQKRGEAWERYLVGLDRFVQAEKAKLK